MKKYQPMMKSFLWFGIFALGFSSFSMANAQESGFRYQPAVNTESKYTTISIEQYKLAYFEILDPQAQNLESRIRVALDSDFTRINRSKLTERILENRDGNFIIDVDSKYAQVQKGNGVPASRGILKAVLEVNQTPEVQRVLKYFDLGTGELGITFPEPTVNVTAGSLDFFISVYNPFKLVYGINWFPGFLIQKQYSETKDFASNGGILKIDYSYRIKCVQKTSAQIFLQFNKETLPYQFEFIKDEQLPHAFLNFLGETKQENLRYAADGRLLSRDVKINSAYEVVDQIEIDNRSIPIKYKVVANHRIAVQMNHFE